MQLLDEVEKYIRALPENQRIKIYAALHFLSVGKLESIYTKKLRGPVYELRVSHHRFIYFVTNGALYIVGAFRKKTDKTPRTEIEYALKIHSKIK